MIAVIPMISVITVTRNNCEGLRRTLASIRQLVGAEAIESIVIDGHSTDATDAVVESFSDVVTLYEKDEGAGIYGAMNQGIERARGEYLIFMNSGDCFEHSKVIEQIAPQLDGDLVFGRAFHEDGSEQFPYRGLDQAWAKMPFGHQAVFIRSALMQARLYDLSFKIAADFDFVLWALKSGKRFKRTEVRIAVIEAGGVSAVSLVKRVRESYRAARRYFSSFEMHVFYWRKLKWALVSDRKFFKRKLPRG